MIKKVTFSLDCKYGYALKIFTKKVINSSNENTTEEVICFQTLTDQPSMLTNKELKLLICHLSSYIGIEEVIEMLKK